MFPVERKNEYLNYVMITEPYDEWSEAVFYYISNNEIKNWKEGFNFVVKYADDPSWYAYLMTRGRYAEPEWAMRVIENATSGKPSRVAYWMVRDGHAEPEWAMKVIENDIVGEPSEAAYWMVRDGHAEPERAMKVIENATTGDPSWVAYNMLKDGFATKEWYEEIKRKFNASN